MSDFVSLLKAARSELTRAIKAFDAGDTNTANVRLQLMNAMLEDATGQPTE